MDTSSDYSGSSECLRSRSNSITSIHSILSSTGSLPLSSGSRPSSSDSQPLSSGSRPSSSGSSGYHDVVVTLQPYMDDQNFSTHLMGKSPRLGRSLYNHTDTEESTVYLEYPPTKPFINDGYERPLNKPVKLYPEGNRKVVITALKNIQEKIHNLEKDRTAAEDKLRSLTSENNQYRDVLQKDNEQRRPHQTAVSKHNQELETNLLAAETRCDLLEKQLEYMRNMIKNAEKERVDAIRTSVDFDTFLESPREECTSAFKENVRKIADLEREHIKLIANQSLAEGKIRELEERLGEERNHRKLMVEKSAEIESAQKTNRILMEGLDMYEHKVPQKAKNKKKKSVVSNNKKKTGHCNKADPSWHYRLNLADIPFVAGKNMGPSYSVGANVQQVFSLMKKHNTALCSNTSSPVDSCQKSCSSSPGSVSPATESDLAQILLQLQDEFHRMSFEHQEFSKDIKETTNPRTREDLERELDVLVSQMDAKSRQISKIRKYQAKLAGRKKKTKCKCASGSDNSTPQPKSANTRYARASPALQYNGEVEVTTTIKPKGTCKGMIEIRPLSARDISLNVLKDMRKLQSTLRKDDLSWQ